MVEDVAVQIVSMQQMLDRDHRIEHDRYYNANIDQRKLSTMELFSVEQFDEQNFQDQHNF